MNPLVIPIAAVQRVRGVKTAIDRMVLRDGVAAPCSDFVADRESVR